MMHAPPVVVKAGIAGHDFPRQSEAEAPRLEGSEAHLTPPAIIPLMRDLELGDGVVVPARLLRASTSRSGGPGGQNVNKVESRVTIEVDVETMPLAEEQKQRVREALRGRINMAGALRVTSQAERSQLANRDRALARMEELLRDALEERAPRRATRVSRAQKQRRVDEKKKRSETKKLRGRIE